MFETLCLIFLSLSMQKIKSSLDKLFILFKLFFIPTILCLISFLDKDKLDTKLPASAETKNLFFNWLNWAPWSSLCQRNCSKKTGKQFRERECVHCSETDCFLVDNKHCSNFETDYQQFQYCYRGDDCHDSGIYTGVWTEWSKIGECDRFANSTQLYVRKCLPSSRTRKLHQTEYLCYDLLGYGDTKREDCTLKPETEYCYWSKWSEWSCSEPCTKNSQLNASRERKCEKKLQFCICQAEPNNITTIELSSCDKCFKKWNEWSSWSECKETCNAPGEYRNRSCSGFGKECLCEHAEYYKCQEEWRACKDLSRMNRCPDVNGEWTYWSDWSECDVTCGYGYEINRRECYPRPQGNGHLCYGPDTLKRLCSAGLTCPIDGGFGEWSEWECDFECEYSLNKRYRECNNPPPSFNGKNCTGDFYESEYGICEPKKGVECSGMLKFENEITFSNNFRVLIKRHLSKTNKTFILKENSKFNLSCNIKFEKQNNKSWYKIEWIHNGMLLSTKNQKLDYDMVGNSLIFNRVSVEDNGIHLCMAKLENNETFILDIFSIVTVTDGYSYEKYPGQSISMPCNGMVLKSIFKQHKIHKIWLKDGIEIHESIFDWKNWKELDAYAVDSFTISELNFNHSGEYRCLIKDLDTDRVWITNILKLNVKEREIVGLVNKDVYYRSFYIGSAIFILINFILFLVNLIRAFI